jgi:hypothetical protein
MGNVDCTNCAGVGFVPAEDPTTAGSGTPAVIQPALRSLSALAGVRSDLRCRMSQARRDAREAITQNNGLLLAASLAREDALMEVLSDLQWLKDEEPEANAEL